MRSAFVSSVIFLLLGGCLFKIDEPPAPEGEFQDRLNLSQILEVSSSTTARFSFDSYTEIFRDTMPFFVDFEGQVFDRDEFLARINQIDAAPILTAVWGPDGVNDGPVLETSPPVELATRSFTLVTGDGVDSENHIGDVKVWVWFNGRIWQVVQWREADGKKSFFHPEYGN